MAHTLGRYNRLSHKEIIYKFVYLGKGREIRVCQKILLRYAGQTQKAVLTYIRT